MPRVRRTLHIGQLGTLAVLLFVCLAPVSSAAAESLQFYTAQTSAQAYDSSGFGLGFSTTHSGSLTMSADANTLLTTFVDYNPVPLASGFSLTSLTVEIFFRDGNITAGSYHIEVSDGTRTDSFDAAVFDDNGALSNIAVGGSNFTITGGISGGQFNLGGADGLFGGIDIAAFANAAPLFGSIVEFFFNPNAEGYDQNAGVNMEVMIPAPPALFWGLAGIVGVLAGRKRLMKVVG